MMMNDFSTTTIDLLRHGECEGGRIFRGTSDVALLPEGFAKMQQACNFVDEPWDHVISSPLKRCREFAESLVTQGELSFSVEDDLREMSFGDWDGCEIERIWQDSESEVQAWSDDPSMHTPPNGEPIKDVLARVVSFYSELLRVHKSKHVLLVTHGGIIRVMLAHLLNMPMSSVNRFDVPYASLTRFVVYHSDSGDITKLVAHNFGPSIK